jgi:hypothetical protein
VLSSVVSSWLSASSRAEEVPAEAWEAPADVAPPRAALISLSALVRSKTPVDSGLVAAEVVAVVAVEALEAAADDVAVVVEALCPSIASATSVSALVRSTNA